MPAHVCRQLACKLLRGRGQCSLAWYWDTEYGSQTRCASDALDVKLALSACFWVSQVRRARAWFPCVDTPTHACPFQLQITVAAHQVAVSCGALQKQTLSHDGPWKTYHYHLERASPPCHLALAVGRAHNRKPVCSVDIAWAGYFMLPRCAVKGDNGSHNLQYHYLPVTCWNSCIALKSICVHRNMA